MNSISERTAYLQGLIEGLKIDESTKEGKVILEIADILSMMAEEMEENREVQDDLEKYIESIDENLSDVEESIFGEEDLEEEYHYDDFKELQCPNCKQKIYVDPEITEQDITCPNCEATIEVSED